MSFLLPAALLIISIIGFLRYQLYLKTLVTSTPYGTLEYTSVLLVVFALSMMISLLTGCIIWTVQKVSHGKYQSFDTKKLWTLTIIETIIITGIWMLFIWMHQTGTL